MFETIQLSKSVKDSLTVQVFQFRGIFKPCETKPDFRADWERLHSHWKGKSKADVVEFPPHAAFIEFYRTIGFNPKAFPPSTVNLVQRFLVKETLERIPTICPLVDAVNIAAVDTGIPLGVFDDSAVVGELSLAFTDGGERFQPLGSDSVEILPSGVLVLRDSEKVLSRFCYRDGETQKVLPETRQFRLLGCQASGISEEAVTKAMAIALERIRRFAEVESVV